jgi:hypothetical protein
VLQLQEPISMSFNIGSIIFALIFAFWSLLSKNSTFESPGKESQKWTHSTPQATTPGIVLLYNGVVVCGVVLWHVDNTIIQKHLKNNTTPKVTTSLYNNTTSRGMASCCYTAASWLLTPCYGSIFKILSPRDPCGEEVQGGRHGIRDI